MTDRPRTVLVVDDQPDICEVLHRQLHPPYAVVSACSGKEALELVKRGVRPDIALLDILMPEMDGHELLSRLRRLPGFAEVPVIFVSALSDREDEQRGFDAGAVDYISKPIHPGVVRARVRTHLELKEARDRLSNSNVILEEAVRERTASLDAALKGLEKTHGILKKTYFDTLMALNELAGLRGAAIASHATHVAAFARRVALRMGLADDEAQDVFIAALLHDIGKVGLPDVLLEKSVAVMNSEELILFQHHSANGAAIIAKIPALANIASLIRSHHELFNGTGYPDGLSGLNIPLGSRIICAVSDYEDLKAGFLASRPLVPKRAARYVIECAGSRYDPTVVEALEPIISADGQFVVEEISVDARNLQPGMRVSRDVRDSHDTVLVARGTVLTRSLIDQLAEFERRMGRNLRVLVQRSSPD